MIIPEMSRADAERRIEVLFGKVRFAVLSLFYGEPDNSFYVSQVLRTINAGHGAIQRELRLLTTAGLLNRRVQGNHVYYRVNPVYPLFKEFKSIFSDRDVQAGRSFDKRLRISNAGLAEFSRKHHIIRLAFFGSVLRSDFRPDSDIDVMVEFEPGHVPGFAFVAIEKELSDLLGRKVDLRTPRDLSRHFREQVVREARVAYEA